MRQVGVDEGSHSHQTDDVGHTLEPAERGMRLVHHPCRRARIGDVAHDGDAARFRGHGMGPIAVDVSHGDLCARLRQQQGELAPRTIAAANHQGRLALQAE